MLYRNCECKIEYKKGHRSCWRNLVNAKKKPEYNQAWTGLEPMTSAMLYQLSYLANWELAI